MPYLSSCARCKLPPALEGLLRSEMEVCIREAGLSKPDALIARRCLIERVPQVEVASELGWTRRTVGLHLTAATGRLEQTARRLGLA